MAVTLPPMQESRGNAVVTSVSIWAATECAAEVIFLATSPQGEQAPWPPGRGWYSPRGEPCESTQVRQVFFAAGQRTPQPAWYRIRGCVPKRVRTALSA